MAWWNFNFALPLFDVLFGTRWAPGRASSLDNVPYEAALRAGCERVYVIVAEADGEVRKRHFARRPHRIDPGARARGTVIRPGDRLPVGRLTATLEGVHACMEAGHAAVARMAR
jgi:hypothetical protein